MIKYCIKKEDCLNDIMMAVTRENCRYWMHGKFKISDVNRIIPKLISKYKLDLSETDRANLLRHGLPAWTLIIHYHPSRIGEIEFWLMTTGYTANKDRSKFTYDQINDLNSALMNSENLNPIITKNPLQLLTFGNYVLGTQIKYTELKDSFDSEYLHPEQYGIPFDNYQIERLNSLSIRSIDASKTKLDLSNKLTENEEEKLGNIEKIFGFLYFKDSKKTNLNHGEVKQILKKNYGVIAPEDSEFNDDLEHLKKLLTKTQNQYFHLFKKKSTKKIMFTWYLKQSYIKSIHSDLSTKIKIVSSRPSQLEAAMEKLFHKANYAGTRHQIGKLSAFVRALLKKHYPLIYPQLNLPEDLHYSRFSAVKYSKFRDFQEACIKETIYIEKIAAIREVKEKRYKTIRTALRRKDEKLKNALPSTLDKIIREHDTFKYENPEPTIKDYNEFIKNHPEMNPLLISESF